VCCIRSKIGPKNIPPEIQVIPEDEREFVLERPKEDITDVLQLGECRVANDNRNSKSPYAVLLD